MKRFLLIILAFVSVSLHAQNNPDELQMMQSLYGMDKRDIVSEFVEVGEDQTKVFWELYDEYELKRQELGKERFNLLSKYVDEYGGVKAADADNFMKMAIQLRMKFDRLMDSYYKKVKSNTDPIIAMQFYQIEHYLSDAIRMELLEEIYTTKKQ